MKLAFFTNIPSHLQIPIGRAFSKILGKKFTMVCWEALSEERRKLGWLDDYQENWLVKAWTSNANLTRAYKLFQSADVVIWGYAHKDIIRERIKNNKLTFRNTERLFKKGKYRLLDPRVFLAIQRQKYLDGMSHHLLSIGPYCAQDYRSIGFFNKRMWRWGYFPETPRLDTDHKKNKVPIILWAGRMLQLKRVDLLLYAVAWACANGGKTFRIKLVGLGPEKENLRMLSTRLGLSDICEFQGAQSPDKIALMMDEADIYVFPSDRNEGWGIVVNEAMSHRCCVIGSKDAGSVPWLIQDGVNGRIFDGKSVENLGQILRWCVDNNELRMEMGISARETITELWSPSVAAERFLTLCETSHKQQNSAFSDNGPCSPAF